MGRQIKTLIAEHEEIISLGLRHALRDVPEILLLGEVRDGKAAVARAKEFAVDLVLIDTGLPVLDGIEATRLIKATIPAKVVIFTPKQDAAHVVESIAAGADAYCIRGVRTAQLLRVIRLIMDGGIYLDSAVSAVARLRRLPEQATDRGAARDHLNMLSPRQKEVLQLLASGLTNQQIAAKLGVGAQTVKTHLRLIMDKLGVTDRTQAAVRAASSGWLENHEESGN